MFFRAKIWFLYYNNDSLEFRVSKVRYEMEIFSDENEMLCYVLDFYKEKEAYQKRLHL